MSATADIDISVRGNFAVAGDLAAARAEFNVLHGLNLQPGTALGQADRLFADTRTIAASSNDDLDLSGSLTTPVNTACVFAKVKAIFIRAAAGNTNNVVIGGAGTNPFLGPFVDASDKLAIPPGGGFLITCPTAAGWAVGAGASDILRIANGGSGTPVTYDIMVFGTSA